MIAAAYKRWRHSRGYGVHSPFAYDIVRHVINPARGYAYYGYHELETASANSPRAMRRAAFLLLRLTARCDVASAFISAGPSTKLFEKAVKTANSKAAVFTDSNLINNARLIVTQETDIELETLSRLLERPGRIVLARNIPREWRESLFEALDEGVMFHDRNSVLIFSRPLTSKVSYSICGL